ncbi:twitching motility protein PilT [Candidatus Gottesmanbacteria bacterium RIFCSPHIGHO2_02_FULL_40_13]|uniref:Ribonuclease VapC n=1 Tax=Candidatus Gottesmanbacteria bacterium RIFCSPHIGHO2_02_FULL_40_13 TaxID=1798384 RepID=A0A1F6A8A8_9BACT|nr:MAG: twitching motility protein PilT [Candidatus Gottesmanbacteria bacterium RIFCSPHIGHO2_02_FULL_40_13]
MSKLLLDTNAYSKLVNLSDRSVKEAIEETETVFISTIILGELLSGFKRGSLEKKNRELLNRFLDKPTVEIVSLNKETAEIYADVLLNLIRKGTPIPTNDIWIAASAIEHGAVLVTYDTHFLKIPGLRLWDRLKIKN